MEVSKNTVAALLVIFIFMSAVGTWYTLSLSVSGPAGFPSIFTGGNVGAYVPGPAATVPQQAGVSLTVSSQ